MSRLRREWINKMNDRVNTEILDRFAFPEQTITTTLSSSSVPKEVSLYGNFDIPGVLETKAIDSQSSNKKGERKMADSQSRYGIIEEMKNKKVNAIGELSNLKNSMEKHIANEEDTIANIDKNVKAQEALYKINHEQWKKKQQTKIKQLELELNDKIKEIDDNIKDRDETYEQQFQDWKKTELTNKTYREKELERYKTQKQREIETKDSIIAEIEQGISDLKQISKEQKGDEK